MDNNQKVITLWVDAKGNKVQVWYPFCSLENYKKMHKVRAKKMKVLEQFMSAPTLTQARKIVFP